VSAAEKRQRMLSMFHREAGGQVFTTKEVSKAASKEGIVAGAVESVLKELVSDNLVHEAKIGGTIFFWSFPGEAKMRKRAELAKAQSSAAAQEHTAASLQEQVKEAAKAHGHNESEAAQLRDSEEAITGFKRREAEANAELERLRKSSDKNMALRRKDLPVLKDAANRWTDNLFQLRSHLVNTCGAEPAMVDKELGTDKIDYIE